MLYTKVTIKTIFFLLLKFITESPTFVVLLRLNATSSLKGSCVTGM